MKASDVMERVHATVYDDETLGLARQVMLWSDVRYVPVLRRADGHLLGMLGEHDVLRAHQTHAGEDVARSQVRDFVTTTAARVFPDTDLREVAAQLAGTRVGCVAVMDGGKLAGVLTVEAVLDALARTPVQRYVPAPGGASVRSVMTPDPLIAHADDRLLDAVAGMLRKGVRHLCVVDDDGHVLGMLSDRDVRRAIGDPRRALERGPQPPPVPELRVGTAMTPRPRILRADESLEAAFDGLLRERFGALPVVDAEERLCGIVSYIDVLRRLT